jgi:hypothetical protein
MNLLRLTIKPFVSAREYLEREKTSPLKHEYYKGEVFSMAGIASEIFKW